MTQLASVMPYCHKCEREMIVYGYQYYDDTKIVIYRCPIAGCSSMQVISDNIISKDKTY